MLKGGHEEGVRSVMRGGKVLLSKAEADVVIGLIYDSYGLKALRGKFSVGLYYVEIGM